jgi:5-methylcytosine-specific restriction endonuclease McrA
VFERDDFTCAYCGRRYAARDLTVDHVIPASQGGAATWGNTVAACVRCNPAAWGARGQRKADRTPHEAGTGNYTACVKLLIEPKAPRTSYLVASGDVPAAWKVWIEL